MALDQRQEKLEGELAAVFLQMKNPERRAEESLAKLEREVVLNILAPLFESEGKVPGAPGGN